MPVWPVTASSSTACSRTRLVRLTVWPPVSPTTVGVGRIKSASQELGMMRTLACSAWTETVRVHWYILCRIENFTGWNFSTQCLQQHATWWASRTQSLSNLFQTKTAICPINCLLDRTKFNTYLMGKQTYNQRHFAVLISQDIEMSSCFWDSLLSLHKDLTFYIPFWTEGLM